MVAKAAVIVTHMLIKAGVADGRGDLPAVVALDVNLDLRYGTIEPVIESFTCTCDCGESDGQGAASM